MVEGIQNVCKRMLVSNVETLRTAAVARDLMETSNFKNNISFEIMGKLNMY